MKKLNFIIILIGIAIISRLIPHPPNFTPITAIALFSTIHFKNKILTYLIIEKESTKKHIQENILNIKSTIQTSSLDSHLTRIRKKMNQIETDVKIQSKNEILSIII